jgi:hypothetical protein
MFECVFRFDLVFVSNSLFFQVMDAKNMRDDLDSAQTVESTVFYETYPPPHLAVVTPSNVLQTQKFEHFLFFQRQ